MPPIREHDFQDDQDDDDDLPSLVDQPMTYTFSAEMTPLSFDPTSATVEPPISPFTFASSINEVSSSPPPPPVPPRSSHGKRRDASYIPRPPNAFILFRSSFIRSQQVTGKVEGNHSNLSKIIGLYWKTLPKEERDEWEAKAAAAQLEHRKRYPDWRFRPGANASAKLKIKDGGTAGPSKQRRIRNTKDPPDGGGGEESHDDPDTDAPAETKDKKGKGRAVPRRKAKDQAKEREKEKESAKKAKDETRFAKIADLLVEGKTGVELEIAVQEWEGSRKAKKRSKHQLNTSAKPVEGTSQHKDNVPAPLVISVASPDTVQSPSTSPSLSVNHNTQSPLSLLSPSTPATPDTDTADRESISANLSRQRRHLPQSGLRSRRSQSRSRSRSRPSSESSTRSRSPTHAQEKPVSPTTGGIPLTQMFKRSLSAPAPHHRSAYPRITPLPSPSLPLSAPDASSLTTQAPKTKRLRHRASESVSFSFNNLHMSSLTDNHNRQSLRSSLEQTYTQIQRQELPLTEEDLSSSPSSPPSSGSHTSSSTRRASHLHPQSAFYLSHHQPHQPISPPLRSSPARLTWQQEENRRRMEVDAGYAYWWRPPIDLLRENASSSSSAAAAELYEPVREGSFEYDAGIDSGQLGYPASAVTVASGDDAGTMDRRYLEQFPQLSSGQEAATTAEDERQGIEWRDTQAAGRIGLVASSPSESNTHQLVYSSTGHLLEQQSPSHSSPLSITTFSPTIPTTLSPVATSQQHMGATETTTTATTTTTTTTGNAGQYFYTIPPTPISPLTPFSSTFSSLAGWDGESRLSSSASFIPECSPEMDCNRKADANGENCGSDAGGSPSLQNDNGSQGGSSGGGGLQSLGLQGGRGWMGRRTRFDGSLTDR